MQNRIADRAYEGAPRLLQCAIAAWLWLKRFEFPGDVVVGDPEHFSSATLGLNDESLGEKTSNFDESERRQIVKRDGAHWKMIAARWTMHLPSVRDLLNSSSSFCCRSLIMTFAAVPAMGRSPHNRETGGDTVFASSVKGRFNVVALGLPCRSGSRRGPCRNSSNRCPQPTGCAG